MKLIAHRGGSVGSENSLATIIKSAKLGADAVECDIRKTKDGVLLNKIEMALNWKNNSKK